MIQQKTISDALFTKIVQSSPSLAEAARTLGLPDMQVGIRAKLLGIGTQWRACRRHPHKHIATADSVRLSYLSNKCAITSSNLRALLISTGIKEARCEYCGNSEWMGYPIPLELHHKNQDHHDNSEDNLMVLCPTCHTLITKKDKLDKEKEAALLKLKNEETERFYKENGYPADKIHGKKFNIDAAALIALFQEKGSYISVAALFGITTNSLKKRCRRLGIMKEIQPIIQKSKRAVLERNRRPMSTEIKAKISASLKRTNAGKPSIQAKQVEQLDTTTCTLVGIFPSVRAAAQAVGAKEQNITNCCNGKALSCKGYKWKFHIEHDNVDLCFDF